MDDQAKVEAPPALTLEELQRSISELRTFVARRFDEVSFEVNATGQIMGMTEDAMTSRFTEVMSVLGSVSFQGNGNTPHNVGVELESVLKTTEEAANKILDAVAEIGNLTQAEVNWADEAERKQHLGKITAQTDAIMAACAFQDLTGQRIAQTLENIRKAESDLADTLEKMGLKVDVSAEKTAETLTSDTNRAQTQSEIDALFG